MTNKIKSYRAHCKLSQRQLARSIGTSQAHLQRIESGVSCPTIALASRLCSELHAAPCAIFPELASTCGGLPILSTSDPDYAHAAPSASDWQVHIFGANEFGVDYWVAAGEARRIQQAIACFNSAVFAQRAEFLLFTTSSRAVAVHLSLIDRICLECGPRDDPFRRKRRYDTTDVDVFLRAGTHFSRLGLYVNEDEREVFATNFGHFARAGRLPSFTVTKGPSCSHVVSTERIALIEMARDLLDARGCCCSFDKEP